MIRVPHWAQKLEALLGTGALGRRPWVRLVYRRLPPQDGVLVLKSEQAHGGEQADQRQPAGSRVQETLALYALAA